VCLKAYTFILIKFGVDVPYEKIMLFKSAVESFVKARPREWLNLVAFRATRVEYDAAYVEYITVLQHVEVRQLKLLSNPLVSL